MTCSTAEPGHAGVEERVGRDCRGHRLPKYRIVTACPAWAAAAERCAGETVTLTCGFLFLQRLLPLRPGLHAEFAGIESFGGEVIHPQHWPEDLDYAGKRVVVIGSGATAMTLVPAMAKDAAKVTMLQRSPTYVISMPGEDAHRQPPARAPAGERVVYPIVRWKNVLAPGDLLPLSRKPAGAGQEAAAPRHDQGAPAGYDVDKHFKPKYNPWDQRVCLVPTPTSSGALRTAAPRSSPTGSRPSPRTGSSSSPGRSSRPTSSSPRPASTCSSSAA